jgi:hypothetical protein
MKTRLIEYVLLGLLGIALAACASQPRRDLVNLPGKDGCFWTRSLFNWTVLDDSTLVVHAPMKQDAYLIKLFAPISGLTFHERLGFEGGGGDPAQICSNNAYMIAGGPIPEREPIVAVRSLTPDEAKTLLASRGTKPAHQTPPAGGN